MCPNPLFVSWVEELRDQAKEKGCKSQYSYTKVINYAVAIGLAGSQLGLGL